MGVGATAPREILTSRQDLPLSSSEIAEATHVPIIASGGVGTLDDLRTLRELPIQGAIVGKALYENAFTIDEAIQAFETT